jgi:hypothetical protein
MTDFTMEGVENNMEAIFNDPDLEFYSQGEVEIDLDSIEESQSDSESDWKWRATTKKQSFKAIPMIQPNHDMAKCYTVSDRKPIIKGPYPRMVYVKCQRKDCQTKGITLNPYFDHVHFHTTFCNKQSCNHDDESCVIILSLSQCK